MNAYIVYKPARGNKKQIALVTTCIDSAKQKATELRDHYLKKGWENWARAVAIKSPNSADAAHRVANELVKKGNAIDMYSQGGTYSGEGKTIALLSMDTYYEWAQLLRSFATAADG